MSVDAPSEHAPWWIMMAIIHVRSTERLSFVRNTPLFFNIPSAAIVLKYDAIREPGSHIFIDEDKWQHQIEALRICVRLVESITCSV
ncbi:MAG: hypothetical protein ROR55_03080 [Devosia sp.]